MHKKPDENANDDNQKENGIHPLYPTNIHNPFNGVQVPIKTTKPTKLPPTTTTSSKYDYEYEFEDDDDDDKKPIANIGPGFFNPTLTKHQYIDYDQNIFNNNENYHRLPSTPHNNQPKPQKPNQYNPFIGQQHGNGKHELINILGGNLPPHLHIEHILQQIQNGNSGGSDVNSQSQSPFGSHQLQHGLNYPFGIGQHPSMHNPNQANQKVPIQPQGNV